ncbi:HNH endonuclease [Altererythrobacter sp. ZODW24]|uniref:HNH endonuclease n=1 Tax=Altererythrobacter sp. ZODW24 TaxID=2185142 RepID=UPI001F073E8F|nr:HNH endonuclease [Altererythrobacter sp. ZODW24]
MPSVGSWIIYLEPKKVANSRGYFAAAKIEKIIPDPTKADMYLALIEPGSYIDFAKNVPFSSADGPIEKGLLNAAGALSGRAQAAVRPLSGPDFARIVEAGLPNDDDFLPRVDEASDENRVKDEQAPFEVDRPIIQTLVSRKKRDQLFRRAVLAAYDNQCAVTGWKLLNGGGRAEVQAAHIRPVEHNGPDSIQNGLALSGTAHWMFDRGLISLADDHEIVISRKVNDRQSVEAIVNNTGRALVPERLASKPHPAFLNWHREYHHIEV